MCSGDILNTGETKTKMKATDEESVKRNFSYHEVDKKKVRSRKNCHSVIVVILIAVNISLVLGLLTLVIKWRAERIESLEPREQTICVPCEEIGLDRNELPDEVKDKITVTEGDDIEKSECCGKASAVLDLMVSKTIRDRHSTTKSSLHLFETKECKKTREEVPSAQMNGISLSQIAAGKTELIHWNTTGTSFLKGGITYNDGKLSTNQSGYYYIFSQIKFRKVDHTFEKINTDLLLMEEKPSNRFDLNIYKHSSRYGETVKILESSKSGCEVPTSDSETTNSIGAVFYLDENDEVFVNTSHPESLIACPVGNHFGIYLT